MEKDPAFLFYSKDFYEGTRMMLPEERACYVDLLIYQHQNGPIPLDLKRVLMYCSGVDKATLEATLEAKFKRTSEGWINERLKSESEKRISSAKYQSENGKIGQFWKKINQILKKNELSKLKKNLSKELIISIYEYIDFTDIHTLEGSLKRCLSNIIENVNENINNNILEDFLSIVTSSAQEKNSTDKKFTPPTVEEVKQHCQSKNSPVDPEQFVNFYQSKGWKVGDQSMKDWKAAIVTWEKKMREKGLTVKSASKTSNQVSEIGDREFEFMENQLKK